MKEYTFAYGHGVQTVRLPEDHILYELRGRAVQPVADVTEAVRQEVRKQDMLRRLMPCRNLVIVVSDATRPVYTPQILDALIGELQRAGLDRAHITLLVALGTHRPATEEELKEICGPAWAESLRIVQHDCRDAAQLAYVGTTRHGNAVYLNRLAVEADRLIVTGGISLHDMAGFSGGRKAIVPGIAGYDTIMANHALALQDSTVGGRNPACDAGRLDGNPMHDDMVEGAACISPDFMINTVLAADGSVCRVVAGHWLRDWQDGCHTLREADCVPISQLADVTIVSAGGYPKDVNFYQATKAHMNAVFATKPGGILIVVSDCPDVAEPPSFGRAFLQAPEELEAALRSEFAIPAFSAYKTQDIIRSLRAVFIVTRKENASVMRQSGQIPVLSLEEAWRQAQDILRREGNTAYTITLMPYGAATLPVLHT